MACALSPTPDWGHFGFYATGNVVFDHTVLHLHQFEIDSSQTNADAGPVWSGKAQR